MWLVGFRFNVSDTIPSGTPGHRRMNSILIIFIDRLRTSAPDGVLMQCFFDFFEDVCSRMLTFRSFFGQALSRNVDKSNNSVTDIPQKVKKTSSDIAILWKYRTVDQHRFLGSIFVDRLGTLASLG